MKYCFISDSWANFGTNIKKRAQNSKKGQKRQKYLIKLEIIRYKCHSDIVMSSDSKILKILKILILYFTDDFTYSNDKSINCSMIE